MEKKILGIDLSGKEGKTTGFCLIYEKIVLVVGSFRSLNAIKEYINVLRPDIVAIDAPLNHPTSGHYRDCDIMLKKYGMHPLPLTMKSMKMLIERAISLTNYLDTINIKYIETFPAGALKMLGYKRKPKSKAERFRYFKQISKLYGLSSKIDPMELTKDEFDAYICAIAGYAYTKKRYIAVTGKECKIILPFIENLDYNEDQI